MSGDDDLISISAAADAIGINKSTLSRQVKAGLIRSHGGKVRLSEVIEDREKNIGGSRATPSDRSQLATSVAPLHEPVARNAKAQRATHATSRASDDATPIGDALELISISAAAKAIGINKSTLKRQIDSGAVRHHEGKVRLVEVLEDRAKNIDLSKSKGKRKKPAAVAAGTEQPEVDELGQLEMVLVDGALLSFADAQRLKENYIARKHHLDYLTKSRVVVDRRAAEDAFFALARQTRDAWATWAPRISTLLAAEVGADAALLSEALSRHVHQHLSELGEPRSPAILAPEPTVAENRQPDAGVPRGADAAGEDNG